MKPGIFETLKNDIFSGIHFNFWRNFGSKDDNIFSGNHLNLFGFPGGLISMLGYFDIKN